MGQVRVTGRDAASFLEKMTVIDTQALVPGQASLSLLMLEHLENVLVSPEVLLDGTVCSVVCLKARPDLAPQLAELTGFQI